jgi:hypothetical protein
MDPTKALYDLLIAMQDGERGETIEHLQTLQEWINRNGFLPDVYLAVSWYRGTTDQENARRVKKMQEEKRR